MTPLLPLGIRILVAVLVFYLGRALARVLLRGLDRVMEASGLEVSLRKFLRDLANATMQIAVLIAALDTAGVEMTAVLAILGAAGLAIGLALQGSLSNFAAGVMIIVLRPYKVTDLVVIGKYLGRVEAIRVFHTVLVTADHRQITIPNAQVIAQPLENLTALGQRRIDLIVGVFDARELYRVKQLIEDIVLADPRVQPSPVTAIEIAEVTETMVKLHVRPWTSVENYASVGTETMERIREQLTSEGIRLTVAFAPG
jgi:small conductance mechanosensitive channel